MLEPEKSNPLFFAETFLVASGIDLTDSSQPTLGFLLVANHGGSVRRQCVGVGRAARAGRAGYVKRRCDHQTQIKRV